VQIIWGLAKRFAKIISKTLVIHNLIKVVKFDHFRKEGGLLTYQLTKSPVSSGQSRYSLLKLFTGLAIAAFIALKLIVANAIMIEAIPPATNNHKLILMR
jgi:hypothetical protein